MALTETRPQTDAAGVESGGATRTHASPVEKVLGTGDHKTVGRLFIGASLLFLACDLIMAAVVNFQASSGGDLLEKSVAARFTMAHPLALLLCGAMPLVLGLAVYLVPLQLGSSTLAFPRAAAMSLWSWLFGTALFTVAVLVKGSYGGSSETMTKLGHVSVGLICVSLLVGVVAVMTTVMSHRPAGMSLSRIPFFSFSMLVTGAVWLGTIPAFLAHVLEWSIRRPSPTDYEFGAYPALEWLFRQPSIYLVAIPLLGIIADVCGSLSGQRQRMYGAQQASIVAFGALAFGAWAQVAAARETLVWVVAAIAIALPLLGVLGGSLDTLRRGKLAVTGGLVFSVLSIVVLLTAIASGAVLALSTAGSSNWFDVAVGGFATGTGPENGPGLSIGQFYLVIGAVVLGGLGATFHWGSRLFRGGLPSIAGLALAPLGLLGALAFGLGHVILGLARPDASGAETLAAISGAGAILLGVTALGAFAAVVAAALGRGGDADGSKAPESTGGTFEWSVASPPPAGNFMFDHPAVESAYPVLDQTEQGATR